MKILAGNEPFTMCENRYCSYNPRRNYSSIQSSHSFIGKLLTYACTHNRYFVNEQLVYVGISHLTSDYGRIISTAAVDEK